MEQTIFPVSQAMPSWSDPNLPAEYWQIDIGPFKDRFDTYGYPGLADLIQALARTNDVCYAAQADLVGRKFVDLKLRRARLLSSFQKIAAAVKAAGKPEFTEAMQVAIVDAPTTDYERYLKGLPQPTP